MMVNRSRAKECHGCMPREKRIPRIETKRKKENDEAVYFITVDLTGIVGFFYCSCVIGCILALDLLLFILNPVSFISLPLSICCQIRFFK